MRFKKAFASTAAAAGVLTLISFALRGLGMLFRVYLSGRMGSAGLGLYQLVMSVYSLFASFATAGFTVAVSRLAAEKLEDEDRARGRAGALRVLYMSSLLAVSVGLLAAAVLYFGAGLLADNIIMDTRTALPLKILALSMPFMSLSACLKGYFTAVGQIYKPSMASLFEQCAKIAITVYSVEAVFSGDPSPAVLCKAVVAGLTAGEALSYIFLFVLYLFSKKQTGCKVKESALKTTAGIARVTVPIAVSSYITTLLHSVESVLIPIQFVRFGGDRDKALGVFGVIRGMTIPMLFFPFAFLGALFSIEVPAISRLNTMEDKTARNRLIERIMDITIGFSIISGVLFALFPNELSLAMYGSTECALSTRILALVTPFMYVETVSDGLLKSIGEQNKTLIYSIINSVFRIAMVVLYIPHGKEWGYLWLLVASNLLSFVLCFGRLIKVTGCRVRPVRQVVAPLFCALAGALAAKPLLALSLHRTVLGVLICCTAVAVYLVLYRGIRRHS